MDDTQKILAALGYPIGIIALIMAIIERKDKDMKFHAFQGLFYNIAFAVILILWNIIAGATLFVGVGLILFALVPLLWIAFVVIAIVYAVKAYKGQRFHVPVIGKWAQNIAYKR
ncbi:DUF4870 domain-containing protein [Candidatus Woesearchaeota archaeon]|nr:DUF4870 domain-containing protein [Candidatus Woesearchaeota archaeon]MBW3014113.1 DUF4870 domain-containing protein [Candidatus Woesearchaeota archaeon]